MIKLDIKPAPTSGTSSDYFYIDVVGVRGEKKFKVSPELPQGRSVTPYTVMGCHSFLSLISGLPSHGASTSPPRDITGLLSR